MSFDKRHDSWSVICVVIVTLWTWGGVCVVNGIGYIEIPGIMRLRNTCSWERLLCLRFDWYDLMVGGGWDCAVTW